MADEKPTPTPDSTTKAGRIKDVERTQGIPTRPGEQQADEKASQDDAGVKPGRGKTLTDRRQG